jgi:small subunit ribosomal protein S20
MSVRRATRTAVSRARRAVAATDPHSEEAVRNAMSMLDVAVRKGLLHKNNASRRKGRLVTALNRSRDS